MAAHRKPDFVTQARERVRQHGGLAAAIAVDSDLEFLDDPPRPLGHHNDAFGEVHSLVHVVRNQHHGLALLQPKPAQFVLHQFAGLRIKGAERLIEQQNARIVGQRARDRDALFHAARQLARKTALEAFEAHRSDQVSNDLVTLAPRGAHHLQAVVNVLLDGEPRKKRIFLEDDAAVSAGRGHFVALDQNRADVTGDEPTKDIQ